MGPLLWFLLALFYEFWWFAEGFEGPALSKPLELGKRTEGLCARLAVIVPRSISKPQIQKREEKNPKRQTREPKNPEKRADEIQKRGPDERCNLGSERCLPNLLFSQNSPPDMKIYIPRSKYITNAPKAAQNDRNDFAFFLTLSKQCGV